MSKKILIIEDEKNLARFVSLELQHEGYSVVIETNGRLGLQMALDNDFDLILLDLMLPDMDGFEITRRLRLEKETSIIMMTARDSIMDIVAVLCHYKLLLLTCQIFLCKKLLYIIMIPYS